MSNISGLGGGFSAMMHSAMGAGTRGMQRPDPAQMAENLFSKLDTDGQGSIDKSELTSALSGSSSTNDTSGVDALFSKLDGDSDGKVSKQELTDALKQFDSQMRSMRMNEMRDMPPSPPPNGDGSEDSDPGLTKDQLTSMANELSSKDSKGADLFSKLAANFSTADSNGDGRVTRDEAMAYDQSSSKDGNSSSSSSSTDLSEQVMKQIAQLLQSYGGNGFDLSKLAASSSVSATA
ncbi:MAG: EF-hand domain-containing protein [Gammaproteobacteria bacterium]